MIFRPSTLKLLSTVTAVSAIGLYFYKSCTHQVKKGYLTSTFHPLKMNSAFEDKSDSKSFETREKHILPNMLHNLTNFLEKFSISPNNEVEENKLLNEFEDAKIELTQVLAALEGHIIPYLESHVVYSDCMHVKKYVTQLREIEKEIPEISKLLKKLSKTNEIKANKLIHSYLTKLNQIINSLKHSIEIIQVAGIFKAAL